MASQTGENEQGLRKILELTKGASMIILFLHFYYYCYNAFMEWKWTTVITDRLLKNVERTGLFNHFNNSKYFAFGLLIVSLIGARGKKSVALNYKTTITYLLSGAAIYFLIYFLIYINISVTSFAFIYITATVTDYILFLTGGTLLSRVLW
jgi:hypothetical protein